MKIVSILLVSAIILFTSYLYVFTAVEMKFKISMTVSVDGVAKTGTGVIKIRYCVYPDSFVSLGGADTHPDVFGSAITVDLGKDGLLFLTFRNAGRSTAQNIGRNSYSDCALSDIACLPMAAYGIRASASARGFYSAEKSMLKALAKQRGIRNVPLVALPEVARFVGTDDPMLVAISPTSTASIGNDKVTIEDVSIQITNDAVTTSDLIWPKWLQQKQDDYIGVLKGPRHG